MAKSDELAEALGSIDELNSWIGLCRNECKLFVDQCGDMEVELRIMQKNLLVVGSSIAGSGLKLKAVEVTKLEKLIDKLTKDLPRLSNFIFPTGVGPAATLQISRSMARRAERKDKDFIKSF
jgi:cob(I)alamin adenosyltransferase